MQIVYNIKNVNYKTLSSRVLFDYLNSISDKNNEYISIDELNYISYSFTNTELDFSSYS